MPRAQGGAANNPPGERAAVQPNRSRMTGPGFSRIVPVVTRDGQARLSCNGRAHGHVFDGVGYLEVNMVDVVITSTRAGGWTARRRHGDADVVSGRDRFLDRTCLPPPIG